MNSLDQLVPLGKSMHLLSRLVLKGPHRAQEMEDEERSLKQELSRLPHDEFEEMIALAQSNHVIVRALEAILTLMRGSEETSQILRAKTALATEKARIANVLTFLARVWASFEERGYDVTVIKSLDHWPDFGSDLDLYTSVSPGAVISLMRQRFGAQIAPRSWGDRLAHKWNFAIAGLPELIEIHVGRLGQTGEQVTIASGLSTRSRAMQVGGNSFRVPSSSDRVMISTMQRMYRHFYFRLCDVLDTCTLAEAGDLDYANLRFLARGAGIWEGVATYLAIVSDYVERYRGFGLDLPQFVTNSARIRGSEIFFKNEFLRVPILPHSARLYGSQLAGVLAKGELHNGVRLSLLPWLAAAAAVGYKFTGRDKGIW